MILDTLSFSSSKPHNPSINVSISVDFNNTLSDVVNASSGTTISACSFTFLAIVAFNINDELIFTFAKLILPTVISFTLILDTLSLAFNSLYYPSITLSTSADINISLSLTLT